MSDPQTPNKFLFTPAHNADIGFWDQPVNANWQGLDQALGTYTTLNANGLNGTVALTSSQAIPLGFIVTGTPAGSINYQIPAGPGGLWLVRNRATLGASITVSFSSASGGPAVNIPAGSNLAISADGTSNGMGDIDTVPTSVAGGSNTQVQVNVASVLGGYAGFTYDGTTLHVPNASIDGNVAFGIGAGSTLTINGTTINALNGFNFNAGAFQMNAGGMLGIGTAPTDALVTVGGLLSVTSGGLNWPNGLVQTTSQVLQVVTKSFSAASSFSGTYPTTSGVAPTVAGGTPITALATTFTPVSASSTLGIEIVLKGAPIGGADTFLVCLFNGSALVDFAPFFLQPGSGQMYTLTLPTWLASPGMSAQSFTVRIGSSSNANAFAVNSTNNGGATTQAGLLAWISIKELLAG